jgi:Dolichyl-phosphate-mannose-protein mannosyltransferase
MSVERTWASSAVARLLADHHPLRKGASVKSRVWAWLAVALVVTVAATIRLRLLDVPLDRDEGEYAYFGQLMLGGVPPYAQAYNLKLPGIYGVYALVMAVFGQTPAGIRTGLILITSATTVATYLLGARLAGARVGVATAALFAALSLNPKTLGIAAYAEHFALLPVVAGALVLWGAARERRPVLLCACGILFGLGLLVRQSAAPFVAGGGLYLIACGRDAPAPPRIGRGHAIAVFLAGAVVPIALTCVGLLVAGTFRTFWYWVFTYAPYYQADLPTGWRNLVRTLGGVAPSTSVALALAAVGLTAVLREGRRERRAFVLALAASSILGTMMGLQFRPHYFLIAAPALALLASLGLAALAELPAVWPHGWLRWALPLVLVVTALGQPLYASRAVLFELTPSQVSRAVYGRNPFPESVEIARYIREHSAGADRVAVVGSEPQIYFYSSRRSATGYIYTYPLMELQPYASAMQREMITEIETAAPRFLVFVSATGSWTVRPGSDQTIFHWFETYQRGFTRVGVADILPQQETVYRWGEAASSYAPRSDVWLMVFERARSR